MYNTNEKRESDSESVTEAGAGVDGAGGVSVGGGVVGEDAASSSAGAAAGPTGGKSKKRGKRSRQGHKAEKSEVILHGAVFSRVLCSYLRPSCLS